MVKMSKSLGNGVDPMDVIENTEQIVYATLATGSSPGNDLRYSTEKLNLYGTLLIKFGMVLALA